MSWLLLVPALIVVIGSIAKFPTVPTMLFSSAVAFVIGIFGQNFSFTDGVAALVNGFDVTMTQAKFAHFEIKSIPPEVVKLLNRGGMMSMMNTLLIVFVPSALLASHRNLVCWRPYLKRLRIGSP